MYTQFASIFFLALPLLLSSRIQCHVSIVWVICAGGDRERKGERMAKRDSFERNRQLSKQKRTMQDYSCSERVKWKVFVSLPSMWIYSMMVCSFRYNFEHQLSLLAPKFELELLSKFATLASLSQCEREKNVYKQNHQTVLKAFLFFRGSTKNSPPICSMYASVCVCLRLNSIASFRNWEMRERRTVPSIDQPRWLFL